MLVDAAAVGANVVRPVHVLVNVLVGAPVVDSLNGSDDGLSLIAVAAELELDPVPVREQRLRRRLVREQLATERRKAR